MFYYTYPQRGASVAKMPSTGALCNMSALSHALLEASTTGMNAAGSSSDDDNPAKRQRLASMRTVAQRLALWSPQAKWERDELLNSMNTTSYDNRAFYARIAEIRELDRDRMDTERGAMEVANNILINHTPLAPMPAAVPAVVPAAPPPAAGAPGSRQPSPSTDNEEEASPRFSLRNLPEDLTRIPGLYLAQTTVQLADGTRVPEYGLFTSKLIKKHSFILFYTGAWFEKETFDNFEKTKDPADPDDRFTKMERYSLSTSAGTYVLAPPIADGETVPNFEVHPGGAINEPDQRGHTANTYIYETNVNDAVATDEQDRGGENTTLITMPLFACVDIPANTELLWNYGGTYDRVGYTPGPPCFDLQDPKDNPQANKQRLVRNRDIGAVKARARTLWQWPDNTGNVERGDVKKWPEIKGLKLPYDDFKYLVAISPKRTAYDVDQPSTERLSLRTANLQVPG